MNKKTLMIVTVLVFAVIVAAIVILNKQLEKTDQEQNAGKEVSIENQPTIGAPDAPVTIVEFGDYKCPGCAGWSESIYPKLKKDYIDTGKVKFAFINVLFHGPESLLASLASESVYNQDPEAFWDFHDALFAAQPTNQQHDEHSGFFSCINFLASSTLLPSATTSKFNS